MTDFQLGLVALGLVIVVLVLVFNWWQERKYQRSSREAFGNSVGDALVPASTSFEEPVSPFEGKSENSAQPAEAAQFDVSRESKGKIESPNAEWSVLGPDIAAPLKREFVGPGRIVPPAIAHPRLARLARIEALVDGRWVSSAGIDAQDYRVALQLVDREGGLSDTEFSEFADWLAQVSTGSIGEAPPLDTSLALHATNELNEFCNAVDVQIAVHVKSSGAPFLGTQIRALAESGGLKLEDDGKFRRRNESGIEEFRLVREAAEKFSPASMRELTCMQLTVELHVPTAAGGMLAFNRFRQFVEHLAAGLDGAVVDDNGAVLNAAGYSAISRQLAAIYQIMNERGIAPGSAEALRVFE